MMGSCSTPPHSSSSPHWPSHPKTIWTTNGVLFSTSSSPKWRQHAPRCRSEQACASMELEDLDVYKPLDPNKLTRGQKKEVLHALNFLKEKCYGTLKGRTCADGRSQRTLYDKSQTACPTVSTDALMLSIIVDAFERRDIATADVTGAYHKAFMGNFVISHEVCRGVRCNPVPTQPRPQAFCHNREQLGGSVCVPHASRLFMVASSLPSSGMTYSLQI
jgi:hypothetical protein